MTVAGILGHKAANKIFSCTPGSTLEHVSGELAQYRIGAILIIDDDDQLNGILSERDIVRAIAANGAGVLSSPASDYMTAKVVTCIPADTATMLMGLMTENRIRHVPVLENDKVIGVVSIGDVVKARIEATEREAAEMMQYISTAG